MNAKEHENTVYTVQTELDTPDKSVAICKHIKHIYCATTAPMTFAAGIFNLDAQGLTDVVWIFQASSSLLTAPYTSFILENGAKASNIFWQVSSSATLG